MNKITIELTEDQSDLIQWLLEDHLSKVRHQKAEAFTFRIIDKLANAKTV